MLQAVADADQIDPQFDTGTLHGDIVSFGKDITDDDAVLIYSIVALIQTAIPLTIYMLTTLVPPGYTSLKFSADIFIGVWAPTFFSWMSVVIFDSKEMRLLFKEAVIISTVGPFGLYWLALGDLFIQGQWAVWGWYLWIASLLVYTMVSVCYQAIFVPKVIRWINETPLKEYPKSMLQEVEETINTTTQVVNDISNTVTDVVDVVNDITGIDKKKLANMLAVMF